MQVQWLVQSWWKASMSYLIARTNVLDLHRRHVTATARHHHRPLCRMLRDRSTHLVCCCTSRLSSSPLPVYNRSSHLVCCAVLHVSSPLPVYTCTSQSWFLPSVCLADIWSVAVGPLSTKSTRVKGVIMSLALHYWMRDAHHRSGPPVSEMTYTVSSGTLKKLAAVLVYFPEVSCASCVLTMC